MIIRRLRDIAKMVNGQKIEESIGELQIKGVSIDTRTVTAGNLFIPIIGDTFNGHEFVQTAFANGAIAALWQKGQPNPPEDLPLIYVEDSLQALQNLAREYRNSLQINVVGITGSNGKTTTKDMVASVLGTTFKVHKTEGNLNNHIGLPLTILRLEEDTEIAVLEMGMSGKGEIELLSNIARPDVALITNIGESHLLDLGSREGIAEAKLEIISGLAQDGVLIYHGDEPLLTERVSNKDLSTITFGISDKCDYYPTSVTQGNEGTTFTIPNAESTSFYISVLGKHNVNNALATIALAEHYNVSLANIAVGLENLVITNMRTELLNGKNGVQIINDAYNASPTSVKAAVELVQDLTGYTNKFVVLGDMLELGENEVQFHLDMGRFLDPERIDDVFTFGHLGRSIAEGAREKFGSDRVHAFTDKEELVELLVKKINSTDIVLVKGSRGMKLEEVVKALL